MKKGDRVKVQKDSRFSRHLHGSTGTVTSIEDGVGRQKEAGIKYTVIALDKPVNVGTGIIMKTLQLKPDCLDGLSIIG